MVTSAACASFFGFLFGLPQLLNGAAHHSASGHALSMDKVTGTRPHQTVRSNSNLEEVSDWITKIVVGLGLVQLSQISVFYDWYGKQLLDVTGSSNSGFISIFHFIVFMVTMAAAVFGFIFGYIETRTRIASLLNDAETQLAEPEPQLVRKVYAMDQFEHINPQSSRLVTESGLQPVPPTKEDEQLLKLPPSAFRNAESLTARAVALARAGQLSVAEQTWRQVLESPGGNVVSSYKRMADVIFALSRPRDAVSLLTDARRLFARDYGVLRRILFYSLYVAAPEGFSDAIKAADEIREKFPSQAQKEVMIQVWTASAHGQRLAWLERRGVDTSNDPSRELAKAAIKLVIKLQPDANAATRVLMRQLLDPAKYNGNEIDNDLAVFKSDPEISSLITGVPVS